MVMNETIEGVACRSLDDLPESQKIIILENKTLYNFKLRDLLSCWKIALLNSQGLFSKPIAVKMLFLNALKLL